MSYMGKVRPTVALTSSDIEDNAVTTSKLIDDAVTTAKIDDGTIATADIADDAVTADKLANAINTSIAANTAKVTNATHTGDVTGATALTIATDAVDIAMLSATGTADATTFLRGDNAWAAAGGDNTPAFQVHITSDQVCSNGVATKVEFDTEDLDDDNVFDNTTNYRFTVPAGEGGKYFISAQTIIGAYASTKFNYGYQYIYKNGSSFAWSAFELRANPGEYCTFPNTLIMTLVPTDYVEVYAVTFTTDASDGRALQYLRGSRFTGYKMIGL